VTGVQIQMKENSKYSSDKFIRIELTIPYEFLCDIKTTALEGGINYWAKILSYSKDSKEYLIQDLESSDRWYINNEVIFNGINRILVNPEFQIASRIKQYILNGVMEKDSGHIDAEAADCIVQAGLFNEIIFG
jgi:hypothetical protein